MTRTAVRENAGALRVVIVDDESQITDLLRTYIMCTIANIEVISFNDPEEARAFLLQNSVDVLITDYKMPKFDGIQLLRLVSNDTVRVLISGYVSEITHGQLAELKAAFFEKPVPMKELGKIISKAEAKKKGT